MYQALYRVWRPKKFSEMVGQAATVRTLRNQVATGRVAHAYLFCGSRGTGKTSAAKIMARAINCLSPVDGDPCGECESCRMIESGASFDVYEMDAASNSRVEEIRDLLEKVDYPPQFGKSKVYIIDEVHMLSNAAFNALLKTLEEPPEYMVFILATTEPQKLPATILSRCQRFDFGRFTEAEISGHLEEVARGSGVTVEPEAMELIARAAEGGMRDALSILDMCMGAGETITEEHVRTALGTADRAFLFSFAAAIGQQRSDEVLGLIEELMRTGRDVQVFLKDFAAHLRQLLTVKLCSKKTTEALSENQKRYIEQAELFSKEKLIRLMDLCMHAEADTRWAASSRSVLEVFALRACEAPEDQDVSALLERISELERKLRELEITGVRMAADSGPVLRKQQEKPKPVIVETPVEPGSKLPKEVWNDALQILKKSEPSLFGPVSNGKYGGYQEGTYKEYFEKSGEFFVTMLQAPSRKKRMEEILTQCGGLEAHFEAMLAEPTPDSGRTDKIQQDINGLIDMFGREKVQLDG